MTRDQDHVNQLRVETSPTPEQVQALVDGSMEAQRDPSPSFDLLSQLPAPSPTDVRTLQQVVKARLERGDTGPRALALQPAHVLGLFGVLSVVAGALLLL